VTTLIAPRPASRAQSARSRQVIDVLLREAPPLLATRFRPDCCIGAARLALQALRGAGLSAAAVPAEAIVVSPEAHRRNEAYRAANDGRPAPKELVETWFDEPDGRCWAISIGGNYRPEDPAFWGGHLVVLAEDRWLIDLSLPQANRPERGIELTPVAIEVGRNGFAPNGTAAAIVNGSAVRWTRRGFYGWQESPDWRHKWRTRDLAAELLKLIRREVGE
jgi:hypothetical protein